MAVYGTIQTHVYTSRANLPLEHVTVVISRRLGAGRSEILSVQFTDNSGNTKPISIPAPPMEASTSPGTGLVSALVDITADYPNYERVIVQNVPVFPGVTTLQEVQMLPSDVFDSQKGSKQEFDIPKQEL